MQKQHSKYKQTADLLTEENGFVMVTALMFMVILAIMGVASMSIRNTEQSVTQNAEIFQNNFYSVEAVTLEGATTIAGMADGVLKVSTSLPGWLMVEDPGINLAQSSDWPNVVIPAKTTLNAGVTNITPPGYDDNGSAARDRIWYAATESLPKNCGGSNLSDPSAIVKCYDVYGMYDVKPGNGKTYHGRMMLAVGYRKTLY